MSHPHKIRISLLALAALLVLATAGPALLELRPLPADKRLNQPQAGSTWVAYSVLRR